MTRPLIQGAGGKGGGGQHVATEAADSLRSKQFARVIDALSEGEIDGLVDGLKSVYLDGTPIQNDDDSYNFSGVTLIERPGTQAQDYIPGFPAAESEHAVGVEIVYATPVVRTLTGANVDAVRVTVRVPALTNQDTSTGDVSGTSVAFAVDVQNNGGGYVEQLTDTIAGKTTSPYQRSYRIELASPGPWDVRLRRVTADAVSAAVQNKTFWDSYTAITDGKLSYPNTALCALMVDAEQFRGIPTRGYDTRGLLIRVPSNYDPATRIYSGAWDGTFQTAWSDNPAWCFYDMLTTARYGVGEFVAEAQVDKWSLYQIGQYCDELVPDGFGGSEPRFTCNLYLQTQEEAYRVLLNMASIFRGMCYWGAGALVPVQDAPSDPVALYTRANVIGGEFSYTGSSQRNRHTVVLVSWNDPDDQYKQKVEYVEDVDGIERYGIVKTDIVAMGCTSRGQASRLGRWMLYSERLETEMVSFRAGFDAVLCAPGQAIHTSDPVRAGVRMGGRVVSATVDAVTLDAPVTLEADTAYTLWCLLPDGTLESRTVTTSAGTVSELSVETPLSDAPQAESVWVLAADNLEPETWRVVGIREVDKGIAEIAAIEHRADKFDAVEAGLQLEALQTSSLTATPAAPSDLAASEELYLVTPSVVGDRITFSWNSAEPQFIVVYQRDGDNPVTVETFSPSLQIQPAQAGRYTFTVIARNSLGLRSIPAQLSQTFAGLSAAPADVEGLAVVALSGYAHITFAAATDLDVLVGGSMRVRYVSQDVDTLWQNGIDVGPAIPGTATAVILPLLPGAYLVKWVDSSGIESENAAAISTEAANVQALNVVATLTQDPLFTGEKVNTAVADSGLVLDSLETIGDQDDLISTWPPLSALGGGVSSEGSYYFDTYLDLGSTQTARLSAVLATEGFDALDLISARPLVSLWTSVAGALVSDVGAALYVRTTEDDPAGSPVEWSDWQPFFVGDWSFRALEFRLVLASAFVTHNILVSALAVTVDMPDRVESDKDIISGAGGYAVTYAKAFMVAPAVGVTPQNLATGDYWVITAKTATGFTVTFKNAAGTAVSRNFDWTAKAY